MSVIAINKKQLAQIVKMARGLPVALRNKIIRQELRKAAKLTILPTAKARMPVRTGLLRKSLKIRAIKRSRVNSGVRVALSSKDFTGETFYGGFIEYGFRVGARKKKGEADNRRQISGQEVMRSTAKDRGDSAVRYAVAKIAYRITQEAKR